MFELAGRQTKMIGDALLRCQSRLDHPEKIAAGVVFVPAPCGKHLWIESEFAVPAQTQIEIVVFQFCLLMPAVPLQNRSSIKHGRTHRRDGFLQQHGANISIGVICPVASAVNDSIIGIDQKRMPVRERCLRPRR